MPDQPVDPSPADYVVPEYPSNLPVTLIGNDFPVVDMRGILVAGGRDYDRRSRSRIQRISVHHWGPPDSRPAGWDAEYAALLRVRDFHRNTRGWPGYAYHFTISDEGHIYYTGDLGTWRFVVGNDNPNNLAVAYMGDLTGRIPSDVAIAAGRRLIAELRFELFRGDLPVLGHKETPGTDPTACPGDLWLQWKDRLIPASDPVPVIPAGDDREMNIERAKYYAALYDTDPEYVLGGVIAESGCWSANRRPKNPAQDPAYWPDVSEGVLQQTVAWSDEYLDEGGDPDTYPGPATVERILALYRNPDHAFRQALPKLVATLNEAGGNKLAGLCLYNAPAIDPAVNPNRGDYSRGLHAASKILAGQSWREVLGG